jgi:hypothetical protein
MAFDFGSVGGGAAQGAALGSSIMPGWGTAIGAVAGGISGLLGSKSSKKAAEQQRRSVEEANQGLQRGLDANLSDLSSYRGLGEGANEQLAMLMGFGPNTGNPLYGSLMKNFGMEDYQEDPGYQFRLREGEKGINRNALAAGRYNSGATLKALSGYNSDLASQEYGNAFDRWRAQNNDRFGRTTTVSGIGQRAVESGNNDRRMITGQIAANKIGGGNAQAAGTIGSGNAWQQGIGTALDAWQGERAINALSRRPSATQTTGGAGGSYGGWKSPWAGYGTED